MKCRAVFAVQLVCVAVGSFRASAEGHGSAVVQVHANLDIDSLDPAWANDTLSRTIISNLYEPLVALKGDSLSELEPRLAEKVPTQANGLISADGRTYRFPIRKGVHFHDGSELSCADARYSILRLALLDRPTGGPAFHLLKPLAGVLRTRDEHGAVLVDVADLGKRVACEAGTLKITLPKAYAPFLQVLAQYGLAVSKASAVSHGHWDGQASNWPTYRDQKREDLPFHTSANGTGPYELVAWDKATRTIRLRRNPRYWRKPAGIAEVVLKEVPEFSVRRMMIAAGDAHISAEADAQYETQWKDTPGAKALSLGFPRTDAFFFNTVVSANGNPALFSGKLDGDGVPADFFTDKDIRLAFAFAFDDMRYLQEALGGRGAAARSFLPSGIGGSVPARAFDLGKARAHFEKAWNGAAWNNGFRITLSYNSGNAARQAACQILKRNVESLNPKFKIEVRALDWASYLAAMRQQRLPLFLIGYAAPHGDPDSFASAFLHSQGLYLKLQGMKVPQWDEMVEEAAYENNSAKRHALYRQLERAAIEEASQIYLAQPAMLRVMREELVSKPINPVAPGTDFYGLAWRPSAAATN